MIGCMRTGVRMQPIYIKRNDWLHADRCPHAANHIELYFESENELKFYNLEARSID